MTDRVTNQALLDGNQQLEDWLKEALRLNSPVSRLATRMAVKDVKLQDFTIRQGDTLTILMTGLNFEETVYKKPEYFDDSRFNSQNKATIPNYQYIPFSVGRRSCLGRHLGEMIVKLLVTQFCRTFEFKKPEGHEYYEASMITNYMTNPLVELKLK